MSKYMIHACKKRLWYVLDFLIPSLTEQGIRESDICTFVDSEGVGNLEACMRSYESLPINNENTWHLQDDVLVCRDFKTRTEEYDLADTIVCGRAFPSHKWNLMKTGVVGLNDMWFSFPCIMIPNYISRECARFYREDTVFNVNQKEWVKNSNNDDNVFRDFMSKRHYDYKIINLVPNLVAHVDYLIGGSMVDPSKGHKRIEEPYFIDLDLVSDLEKRIGEYNHESI